MKIVLKTKKFHFFFLLLIILMSCKTTINLNLDDDVYIDSMVLAALEGRNFRINKKDIPGIQMLLDSQDSSWKMAGIILAGQSGHRDFIPSVTKLALDNDSMVSNEAYKVIQKNLQTYNQYLINLLKDPNQRLNALILLSKTGNEKMLPIIIQYFADNDKLIKEQASKTVFNLAKRDNPFLINALYSDNARISALAIRTLSHYKITEDMPFFINSFSSEHAEIQKEAQLAALRIGKDGLPYLHQEAINSQKPLISRISALNIIEGLRSIESLPILFQLLDNPEQRITIKANNILSLYGEEAIPALTKIYRESQERFRIHAVKFLGTTGSELALPILAEALSEESSLVALTAKTALENFGSSAWPELHNIVLTGLNTPSAIATDILRNQGDMWLVKIDDQQINNKGIYNLIKYSNKEELLEYTENLELDFLLRESILSVLDASELASNFLKLEQNIEKGGNEYLFLYRQHEIYSAQAREKLRESFNVMHDYFRSKDDLVLNESRKIRLESKNLDSIAKEHFTQMQALPAIIKNQGKLQLQKYTDTRKKLVLIWSQIDKNLREVTLSIFADYNLDPRILTRESSLIE